MTRRVNDARIDPETVRSLRVFTEEAVRKLIDALGEQQLPEYEFSRRWVRNEEDGHFRPQKRRMNFLPMMFLDDILKKLPSYQNCIEQLRSDPVIASQIDRSIGTVSGSGNVGAEQVLSSLIYSM